MKPLSRLMLAGAAFLALSAGTLAVAAVHNNHVLTVQLPDGTIEHIRYTGDVAPTVRFVDAQPAEALFVPTALAADPMFARLEQVSAEMDREAAVMLASLDDMAIAPGPGFAPLTQVTLNALPPGAQGYTMVSTMSGAGVCTRTTRYVSRAGQPPLVKTSMSGSCGDAHQAAPQAAPDTAAPSAPMAAPVAAPGLTKVSYRPR